jgi:hypothetical protein
MITLCLVAVTGCGSGGTTAPPEITQQTNPPPPPPPVPHTTVATFHNDNARTGINSSETVLKPSNVNVLSFGRLATIALEGEVKAQPLYISNITMSDGKSHNLVLVATEHDQVYAIDADSHSTLWHRSFLDSRGLIVPVPASDTHCDETGSEHGITGTPVIDAATETMFLVVRTKETTTGETIYYQRMHALNLANGDDRLPPATITSPAGRDQFGSAHFDPLLNLQRSALLLSQGNVYVAWASHCDYGAFTGWVMSFGETTLERTAAWTPDPSGMLGGIWMSGGGPASDVSGNIFLAVGNGWSDAMSGGDNYGDAVVRLVPGGGLISVPDYFMPFNFDIMYNDDLDLGAGGVVLLPTQSGAPHPNLLGVGGKDGTFYLLDRDNLGKWRANNNGQVVQTFPIAGSSFASPLFWNNTLYTAFSGASFEARSYNPATQQIDTTPISSSGSIYFGFPGATPSLSSNASADGILWLLQTDNYQVGGNEILRAFGATDLSTELYDSEMSSDRDHAGGAIKFSVPTVINGKVYVGALNELDIYGLL